jgi:hypothetical protein
MNRVAMLNDLGEWLGADAEAFLKIRDFIDGLEDNPSPQGKTFLDAFSLVHRAFELVRG